MKKTISLLILIPLLWSVASLPLFSQEYEEPQEPKSDIYSVVRPIYSMFKTKYGVIVYYESYPSTDKPRPSTDKRAFSTPLYIPHDWFLPLNTRPEDTTVTEIYAQLSPLYKNLNAPYIEFFYYDGNQIKEIKVHLTKKDLNAPLSYLPPELRSRLDEEIKQEFENQKTKTIEVY